MIVKVRGFGQISTIYRVISTMNSFAASCQNCLRPGLVRVKAMAMLRTYYVAHRYNSRGALSGALTNMLELLGIISALGATLHIVWSLFFGISIGNRSEAVSQLQQKENRFQQVTYFPLPGEEYFFGNVRDSFSNLDLSHLSEINAVELEELILNSTPKKLRVRLKKYISKALLMAEKYQVDPFWVIAIMWTESHFINNARSSANAIGLMQIKPDTGSFLSKLMKRKHMSKRRASKKLFDPAVNIEIGTYYLSRLLDRFNGNYVLATVSYNMGPTRVRRRLNRNLPVGVRNQYLDKVRRAYGYVSRGYRKVLAKKSPSIGPSYVMKQGKIQRNFL